MPFWHRATKVLTVQNSLVKVLKRKEEFHSPLHPPTSQNTPVLQRSPQSIYSPAHWIQRWPAAQVWLPNFCAAILAPSSRFRQLTHNEVHNICPACSVSFSWVLLGDIYCRYPRRLWEQDTHSLENIIFTILYTLGTVTIWYRLHVFQHIW